MQLIYRGQIIDYISVPTPAYQKPRALNWRYQISGEIYDNNVVGGVAKVSHRKSYAINWRYQLA